MLPTINIIIFIAINIIINLANNFFIYFYVTMS